MIMSRKTTRQDDGVLKHGFGRRSFLKGVSAAAILFKAERSAALRHLPPQRLSGRKTHVAVIGAGAFGGWPALHLLRSGARVTLVDEWGPGNSRASSGGETRIIRGTYGPAQPYTDRKS